MKDEQYFRLKFQDIVDDTSKDYKPLPEEMTDLTLEFERTLTDWDKEIKEQGKPRLIEDFRSTAHKMRDQLWVHRSSVTSLANNGTDPHYSISFFLSSTIKLYSFYSDYLEDEEKCKMNDLKDASSKYPSVAGEKRIRAIKGLVPLTREQEENRVSMMERIGKLGKQLAQSLELLVNRMKPRYNEVLEAVGPYFRHNGKILPPTENEFLMWFLQKHIDKLDDGLPLPEIQPHDFETFHHFIKDSLNKEEGEGIPLYECLCDFKKDMKELCNRCPIRDKVTDYINNQIIPQADEMNAILSKSQFKKYHDEEIESGSRFMEKVFLQERQNKEYINDPYRANRMMGYLMNKERIKTLNTFLNQPEDLSSPLVDNVDTVLDALGGFGFYDFMTSNGYKTNSLRTLLKKRSKKEFMPFSICLLNHIGFLNYFYSQKCLNKSDGHTKLAKAFGVSVRRIKGNVHVLHPNSSEDPSQYTSLSFESEVHEILRSFKRDE